MLHKTKLKIVFWSSLIVGISLCIGGIWLAPLLVPGGIVLGAALAMYQSAYSQPDHVEEPREMVELTQARQPTTDHIADVNNMVIEQNIGLFFIYPNGRREPLETHYPERPKNPSPKITLV